MNDATPTQVLVPISVSGLRNGSGARRTLTISVLRYNPQEPASPPRMQPYTVEEADGMTLFIALNEIREKQDPVAAVRFRLPRRHLRQLRDGGERPAHARVPHADEEPGSRDHAGAVAVLRADRRPVGDTGKWMRGMSERLEGWLHMKDPDPDLRRMEEKMDPDLADRIYELDRCIECGCCVAACGTARMREDFVGAVG
jgi:fumarate reductase iron-sulfur subunit